MTISTILRATMVGLLISLGLVEPVAAIDRIAVEAGIDGYGHQMKLARGALWWSVPQLSPTFSSLRIVTNAELLAGYWWNSEDIFDTGLTPIFRIRPAGDKAMLTPYVEGGVGFHYLSGIKAAGRNISTNFQFGDHLAAGFLLGPGGRLDIAYKFQHLSNAGIRRPNAGVNFHILRFVYRL